MKVAISHVLPLLLVASLANAQSPGPGGSAPGIAVSHAWARATAANAPNGAAYLTLLDGGTAPDQLTGASTPVAKTAELHRTTDENGVMKMRPSGAIALEPGKPVTLAPGGYHVMLMGLAHPLKQGESFPLTLTFAHAAPVTVEVQVEQAGAAAPAAAMDHGTMHRGGTMP